MLTIFNRLSFGKYFIFSVVAAITFCISAAIFISKDSFQSSWILFIGNIFFGLVIGSVIFYYNKMHQSNAKTQDMIALGHITAVIGILLAAALTFILFIIIRPGVYHLMANNPSSLEASPPSLQGNAHGLMFTLLMDTVFGNIAISSFIAIILPFTAKRFQKNDSESKVSSY